MQENDYVSISTTDAPDAAKAAGTEVKETAAKPIESESKESGETAEIEAQDAIETDDQETEADDKDVTADEEDQKEPSEEEKAKPKKKGGFQKKLEKKDREIEFLREQLLKQQAQPEPQKPVEKSVEQKPKSEDFDSHSEYIEALTDWKVEQKARELSQKSRQEAEKSVYQNRLTEFQKKTQEFAKTVEDYEDAIAEAGEVIIPAGMQEAIMESDIGPEILYALAKNKPELMRISKLNLVAQAKEIGKLEAKLAKSEEKKPEVKTKTAAPPPPKPVGTKSPGKVVKDPSDMTPDEYIAWKRSKK